MLTFLKKRKKNPGGKLRSVLGKFELPSFNATVMKVLSLLRDPDSSIKEIAGQVAQFGKPTRIDYRAAVTDQERKRALGVKKDAVKKDAGDKPR